MAATKVKLERRPWNPKEEEVLIGCLRDLEGTIYKQDNVFKGHYLKELEKKIAIKLPNCGLQAKPHIDSKMKTWRKNYSSISTILSYSGASWNDTDKMIVLDDETIWEDIQKKDKNAALVRYKSFRFYEDWCEIFGKDRATGEFAETPLDVAEDIQQVEETQKDENTDGVDPDVTNVGDKTKEKKSGDKKRRRRSGEDWESNMKQAMKEVVGQFTEETNKKIELMATRIGADYDAAEKRQKVNSVVKSLGLLQRDELRASTLICQNQPYCDVFMSLEAKDQAEWVTMLLEGKL